MTKKEKDIWGTENKIIIAIYIILIVIGGIIILYLIFYISLLFLTTSGRKVINDFLVLNFDNWDKYFLYPTGIIDI